MLVFVDESGDPGRKTDSGSSRYFVVTTVVFPDRAVAQLCDERITLLRQEMNLSQRKEFHFSKDSAQIRGCFIDAICGFDFYYSCIVLNKDGLKSEGFKYKDSLYKYTVKLAFSNIFDELDGAKIVFDQCGGREFGLQLQNYVRRKMKEHAGDAYHGKIAKIQSDKSEKNNLLQLADVVCGAVALSYTKAGNDGNVHRKKLRQRERRIQFWPPTT